MPEPSVSSEVEAKLLAPEESVLRAIARLRRLGPYRFGKRRAAHLHSVYLDTPEMSLSRNGVALRVRRRGRQWEATAKWSGRVVGAVHDRPELNVPLPSSPRMPFSLPEGPLQVQLVALVAGRPLRPILVTEIERREIDVFDSTRPGEERPAAELAIDRVEIRDPEGNVAEDRYFEVEIEVKGGDPPEAAEIADLLRQRFPLSPSTESKFSRGLALLHPEEIGPQRDPTPVVAGDTVAAAARKIVDRLLRQLRAHDPGTRLGDNPEELHDMRVATRRLRAAVQLLEAGFPSRSITTLRRDLRWLGDLLGRIRDLDVQLQRLQQDCQLAVAESIETLAGFRTHLEQQREVRRAAMLAGLDSERYVRLLRRLEQFAVSEPEAAPVNDAADTISRAGRRAVRHAFRRVEKRGDRIGKAPEPTDLHAVRIRAKRLRYLLEFLREITGKPGRRLVKDLTRLQDLLGAYHDAVVAEEFIRHYLEGISERESAAATALEELAGRQRERAERSRAAFRKAWQRFSGASTKRDLRAVLRQLETARASGSGRSA